MHADHAHKSGSHILLADDEEHTRIGISYMLRKKGFRISQAGDGAQALSVILKAESDGDPIHLMILDMQMPKMTGADLLSILAEYDIQIPTLVITSFGTKDLVVDLMRKGCTDYLDKPFTNGELIDRIADMQEQIELRRRERDAWKQMEDQLHTMIQDLREKEKLLTNQERLKALGLLAGGMAHDFKNALQPIVLAASLLENDVRITDDRERFLRHVRTILAGARQATSTANRLLHYYRPHKETQKTEVNLNRVILDMIDLMSIKWDIEARCKGRKIKVATDLQDPCTIEGLEDEFYEIFMNLLLNAMDAIVGDGEIVFRSKFGQDGICLEVEDTGKGMPEEVRRQCMEPFFTTKGNQGTGLGLSIVRGIVERYKGRIEVKSQEGRGTIFRIILPSPDAAPEPSAVSAKTTIRILLVDDEKIILTMEQDALTLAGFTTHCAASAEEALRLCESERFDAVMTDYSMPGMNGIQLARAIKKQQPDLPVILVTGLGGFIAKDEDTNSYDLLLTKPIALDELISAVRKLARS